MHGGVTALLFDNTLGWSNAMSLLAERGRLAPLIERARAEDGLKGGEVFVAWDLRRHRGTGGGRGWWFWLK